MKTIHFTPLILFLVIAISLGFGLTLSPTVIPSAKVGKPLPEFNLPPLYVGEGNVSTDSFKNGNLKLINIFASWCVPCRVEHPILMSLKENGIPIYGFNYKDDVEEGRKFLAELGDPYEKVGVDGNGRVGIDLGLSGVPETFVISGDGTILFQHIGPLNQNIVKTKILPLLEGEE